MIKIASLPTIAGALLAFGLSAAPAQAGPNRTWVSGHGTDSGTCALAAPCRTFAFAITQTAAGGEIDVLDPVGYGAATITKAISIVNDGVGVAAIGASSGNAITINAGASDSVHLRGLTIEGTGGATTGILFNSGVNLAIENCVIQHLADGIVITPSTSSSFSVSNTIASNNNARTPDRGARRRSHQDACAPRPCQRRWAQTLSTRIARKSENCRRISKLWRNDALVRLAVEQAMARSKARPRIPGRGPPGLCGAHRTPPEGPALAFATPAARRLRLARKGVTEA